MAKRAGRARRDSGGRIAAAAVLGLVIVGCSSASGSPTAGPNASPRATSGSPTAGPNASPGAAGWSRHELALDGAMMSALLVGGPGYIGAGSLKGQEAAIWTSPDGLAWTRTAEPSGNGWVSGLTAGGPGFVAVGTRSNRAAVWTSTDGLTWSAVPDTRDFAAADGGGLAQMSAVVRGGPGFVAVGVASGGGGQTGQEGAVWTSIDGIAWRRTAVPDPGDWMHDVIAGGPGLVAVGTAQPGTGEEEKAAAWTSVDGTLWTRVQDGPPFANGAIGAVLNGPKGLLAVGHSLDSKTGALHPMSWTSPDGLSWTAAVAGIEPLRTDPPHAFEGSAIADLARVSDGWLAVGGDIHFRTDGARQDIAMWSSSDGATWTRIPDQPEFQGGLGTSMQFGATVVAARNGEVIVIGATAGPHLTVWFSPPRPGGTTPAPLPSAPPATATPAIQATPAPESPSAMQIDSFRSLRCKLDGAFFDAFANGAGKRGPDATAFFDALEARDAKAIASTLPAIRQHLLDAQGLMDASVPWAASAAWLTDERQLAVVLLANLDRIEIEAAAGRAPTNGSSAFLGDPESVFLLAALKAMQEIPVPPGGTATC